MSTRSFTIALAESPAVKGLFEKQGMKNPLVRRFIAGVTLREALLVAKELQDDNMKCALDLLGENVLTAEEANTATESYLEVIRQIAIFSHETYASIKLTSLGLDVSEDLCRENLKRLTNEASQRGGIFIRVDMEGSAYTSRTLDIVIQEHRRYEQIGTVIQSYLRRSDKDLETLIQEGMSVRLVKGAYAEPPEIAYPKKSDVDGAYRRQMFTLLERGIRPAIATQDEDILKVARQFIKQKNIGNDRFEFELLYGVRRDIQSTLAKDGLPVRVYVPFGHAWYPYFTRRLAERPANVGFILGNLAKG
jgi:proline dehydrogenase